MRTRRQSLLLGERLRSRQPMQQHRLLSQSLGYVFCSGVLSCPVSVSQTAAAHKGPACCLAAVSGFVWSGLESCSYACIFCLHVLHQHIAWRKLVCSCYDLHKLQHTIDVEGDAFITGNPNF